MTCFFNIIFVTLHPKINKVYMFENLSDRLERSFKILKGEGKITEINVAETLKDVRRALLDADVNYKVAKQFTDTVKQKAMGRQGSRAATGGSPLYHPDVGSAGFW